MTEMDGDEGGPTGPEPPASRLTIPPLLHRLGRWLLIVFEGDRAKASVALVRVCAADAEMAAALAEPGLKARLLRFIEAFEAGS